MVRARAILRGALEQRQTFVGPAQPHQRRAAQHRRGDALVAVGREVRGIVERDQRPRRLARTQRRAREEERRLRALRALVELGAAQQRDRAFPVPGEPCFARVAQSGARRGTARFGPWSDDAHRCFHP